MKLGITTFTLALLLPLGQLQAAATPFGYVATADGIQPASEMFADYKKKGKGHKSHGKGKGHGHDCNKPGKRKGHPECASPH